MTRSASRVVVIGVGAIGASIGACLAERGHQVVMIDAATPGAGTSGTSFAWINANNKEPTDYFELNRAGVEAHWRNALDHGFVGSGHVEIAVEPAHKERLYARSERLRSRNYPTERLTVEQLTTLLPGLRAPQRDALIMRFPLEGYVHPATYVGRTVARAREAGAQLISDDAVIGLESGYRGGARVETISGAVLHADVVVSATGRWSGDLARLAGAEVPMVSYTGRGDATVGLLAHISGVPPGVDSVITSPRLNLRPAGRGRLVLQALDLDAQADPSAEPTVDSTLAAEFIDRLRTVLIRGEEVRMDQIAVGQRSLPADGRTIVGFTTAAPWLYVVATHSGITLAPHLGQSVADELEGAERAEFAAFLPGRFADDTCRPPSAPRRPGEQ